MVRNILVGSLVAALAGVLIVGAINRTGAKSEQSARRLDADSGAINRGDSREQWRGQQGQGSRPALAETDLRSNDSNRGSLGRFSEAPNSGKLETAVGGGEGLASVHEWLEVVGTVVAADEEKLVLRLQSGQEMVIECRSWSFAQEMGFTTEIGHEVRLYGFDEEGEFEIAGFEDLTSQLITMVREENGRPLWAGRWGRGA